MASVAIVVLALVGVVLLVAGVRRLMQRRRLTGVGETGLGVLLVATAALAAAVALNLHTYHRLTSEAMAAELVCQARNDGGYDVALILPDGRTQRFRLEGEHWRLEARVIKWHGYAALAGFDTVYRLERLEGRYADLASARARGRTVYALASDRGVDLWPIAQRYRGWVPLIDTMFGSAVFMPMRDGARYAVTVSLAGLVARPVNAPARRAVEAWS